LTGAFPKSIVDFSRDRRFSGAGIGGAMNNYARVMNPCSQLFTRTVSLRLK